MAAAYDRHVVPVKRLRSPMRVGLLRGPSMTFKPFARVGLAADGGVFVIPVGLDGQPWVYGNFTEEESRDDTWVLTSERPKLHYHRSGIVAASLTGKELVRRSASLRPLAELLRKPFMTISVVRPWQLPSRDAGMTKGDVASMERTWPQFVSVELSILEAADDADPASLEEIAPVGAVSDDPASFLVDLRAYGHRALILATFSSSYQEWTRFPEPGISVVAFSEGARGQRECFGLWSRSLAFPVIGGVQAKAVPSSGGSADPPSEAPRIRTMEETWAAHANESPGWLRSLAWDEDSSFYDPDRTT